MQYTKGHIGRIFLLKFDNGDVLLDELSRFAKKERLKAATILFIGALRKGDLVTGPKKPVIPPVPNKVYFKDGWEVMGMGTIFTPPSVKSSSSERRVGLTNKSGPQIHIHASMGKKLKTLTGCVRGKSKVFLVIEAVVLELKGVNATKSIDPATGLNLLRVGQ